PAPKPTTSRIGRVGYGSSARAAPTAASASSSSAQPSLGFRLRRFVAHRPLPPLRGGGRGGAHAKICARSPPPPPPPRKRGREQIELAGRVNELRRNPLHAFPAGVACAPASWPRWRSSDF